MRKYFGWITRFDTIFNRLIFSFVVIVVVVAIIADAFLIQRFSANYNRKIENLKENQMKDLEIEINQAFQEANRIIIEIATDGNKEDDVQRVLNKKLGEDFYKATKLLTYLGIVANQNENYVDSVEYYSLRNNLWISTNFGVVYTGSDTDAVLAANEILGTYINYQDYHRFMSERTIRKGRAEQTVYSMSAGYPLFTDDAEKFKGYIVINLKKEAIDTLLSNNLSGTHDAVGIVDEEGRLLLGAGDIEGLANYLAEEKDIFETVFAEDKKDTSIQAKDFMLLGRKLDQGWAIINLVSRKEFYDETRFIQMQCLSVSALVIVIGLLLSYLFARQIYRPFYVIMNKLDQAKLNKKARESEYYYIDRAIDELSKKAVASNEAVNQNIMARLLLGNLNYAENVKEILSQNGYDKIYEQNHLLLIRLHQKVQDSVEKERLSAIYRKIRDFFDQYSEEGVIVIPVDMMNGNICVFVSCGSESENKMKRLRRLFLDYMSMHFMLTPILLQSKTFSQIEDAGEIYKDLLRIVAYIYFLPHTYYVNQEEAVQLLDNPKEGVEASFDQFTEALIARDLNAVESILKHFIENTEVFSYQVDELHGVILKYIFLYNYYLRDIMKEHKNTDSAQIYKEMKQLYDVEDFYYWFVGLIRKTFDDISSMQDNPKKTVIDLVENVIMESLEEENLSLDYIAEKVYLSPKYISRIFKEETGVTITQYTNDCKLTKAAKLLLETSISLEELIKQVGFSSTNYFIKKFKEKYSVTPTQYRRNSVEV